MYNLRVVLLPEANDTENENGDEFLEIFIHNNRQQKTRQKTMD